MMESFLKEMKVLQDCKHPRVVRYIDRVIDQNKDTIYFYIVMEYMKQVYTWTTNNRRYMYFGVSEPDQAYKFLALLCYKAYIIRVIRNDNIFET